MADSSNKASLFPLHGARWSLALADVVGQEEPTRVASARTHPRAVSKRKETPLTLSMAKWAVRCQVQSGVELVSLLLLGVVMDQRLDRLSTRSLTHSLPRSLTHLLPRLLPRPLSRLLPRPLSHSLIHSLKEFNYVGGWSGMGSRAAIWSSIV